LVIVDGTFTFLNLLVAINLIMSKRNKLEKFADLMGFPNVFQNFSPKEIKPIGKDGAQVELKGCWAKRFGNDKPITVELACGRGEYTIQLARDYDDRNFIGVDVKGARIWKGAKMAITEGLDNVAFMRTKIEVIEEFFAPNEIAEIWITFADPFIGKPNRRLTAPAFHDRYKNMLKEGGIVNMKIDDPTLYESTKEVLAERNDVKILYDKDDIYSAPLDFPELEYKTYYEKSHLEKGRKIKYMRWQYL